MTLLKSDSELVEKYKLTDVHELSTDEKKSYIDVQIDGIKQQLWRSRVDAMLNHNIATDGEAERNAVDAKIRDHESDVKRYAEALTLLSKLSDEL